MRYSRRTIPVTRTNSTFEQLSHYLNEFYSNYSHQTLLDTLHKETYFAPWYCYECKKSINVDIRPFLRKSSKFNPASLFCSEHRDTAKTQMKSGVFLRYETSFYSSIKTKLYNTLFKEIL